MSIRTDKCPFCAENDFYLYRHVFEDIPMNELTLLETENFMVIPDIAPLQEGHLLIISKHHNLSLGETISTHYNEFISLKNELTKLLTNVYCKPIFFEHGAAVPKHAGCCVIHTHVHCLPLEIDLLPHISDAFECREISNIKELEQLSEKKISYLYYENNNNTSYVYPLSAELCILPSQFLRKVIGTASNNAHWNWREGVGDKKLCEKNKAAVLRSMEKLRGEMCRK